MRFALTLLALFGLSSTALAQDEANETSLEGATAEEEERARQIFGAGQTAFGEGRFTEAAGLWVRAYELSPRAELLYNIGTAYDRGGVSDRALDYYRRYLEEVPDAPNAAYLRSRSEVLERAIEREEEPPVATDAAEEPSAVAPPPDGAPETDARSTRRVLGGVLLGVAGALAVTAAGTGARALRERAALGDDCPGDVCDPAERGRADRIDRLALSTDVVLGAAGLFAATGLLLVLIRGVDESDTQASLACGGRGCALTLRGVF